MPLSERRLLAGAYAGGIECTLSDLESVWGSRFGELDRLLEVQKRVEDLGLTLLPGLDSGSLESVRVLRAVRADTLADRLPLLLRAENGETEFKSSLFADMARLKNTGDLAESPGVTKSALKTIAALMNTAGGTLLLGVDDSGEVCDGIMQDLKLRHCDLDRLELHLRNLLHTRFVGVDAENYITLEWSQADSNWIAGIDVVASNRPCFLKTDTLPEYFIRQGNRTRSLDLVEFYEHITSGGRI